MTSQQPRADAEEARPTIIVNQVSAATITEESVSRD